MMVRDPKTMSSLAQRVAALCVALCVGLGPAAAAEGEPTVVVVYALGAAPELEVNARTLTDELLVHLGKKPGLQVLGESDIQVMLGHEQDKRVLNCDDDRQCLANLQKALDARKVISGQLGSLGGGFVVTLKMADARKGTIERGETAEAESVADLIPALRRAADRLLGVGAPQPATLGAMELPKGSSVAVMELATHGVPADIGSNLSQILTLSLKKLGGLEVVSRDEIKVMLKFQAQKEMLGCTDDEACLVEIGGMLGVDYLVTGSVGQLGDSYILVLKLMDVDRARVMRRASESVRAGARPLKDLLEFVLAELMGRPISGQGRLTVKSNVDEGQIIIGAREPAAYHNGLVVPGLDAGKWGVTLRAEDYEPHYEEAFVFGDGLTTMRLTLKERGNEWYEEWWTWAIIGGVAIAATTTTLLLLPSDPSSGTVTVGIE